MKTSVITLGVIACSLSACTTTKRVALPLKPPAERLQCVQAGTRPMIPPEHVIDWQRVRTVPQAKSQHDAFVKSVRTREGTIAGYVLETEDKLFACSSNAAWLRDFFGGLPDE